MKIEIGKCSQCFNPVIRDTDEIADDICISCLAVRQDYVIPMRNVYDHLEDEPKPRGASILDYEDIYNVASY